MKILVTAFGPFDGRSENASSLALSGLKANLPEIRTRILPVDSVVAPTRLRQALRLIRPEILILLGEAAGSKTIRLETTAFNELDFRIPDISGRQPTARPIRRDAPPIRRSTLPLKQINTLLSANDHEVILSNNPGRYLCNQILYIALEYLELHALPCRAGFIHLPLAVDYPTIRATDALGRIIKQLKGTTSRSATGG
jgi:pyroglutamyl-peptidase